MALDLNSWGSYSKLTLVIDKIKANFQTLLDEALAKPAAHKTTHATGGADALTPADIGAASANNPVISGNITGDWFSVEAKYDSGHDAVYSEYHAKQNPTNGSTRAGIDFFVNNGYGDNQKKAMRIGFDGNIGIGVENPKADLHSNGSTIIGVTSPNIADLPTSQMTFAYNETTNTCKLVYRRNDGVLKMFDLQFTNWS